MLESQDGHQGFVISDQDKFPSINELMKFLYPKDNSQGFAFQLGIVPFTGSQHPGSICKGAFLPVWHDV